jgi:membrane fusion protein (multidrug efflux system)
MDAAMTFDSATQRRSKGFVVLVVAGLAAAGLAWWAHGRHFESTDDAQMEGHLHAISARVSGTVVCIDAGVENNHVVQAGTLLLELDPADAQAALEQAQAALAAKEAAADAAAEQVPIVTANAFNGLDIARASAAETQDSVAIAEANLTAVQHRLERDQLVSARAERDRQRYAALLEQREISRSEYDARQTDARTADETVAADRANVDAGARAIAQARQRVAQKQAEVGTARTAPQQVSDARARLASATAQVAQAKADLHVAELNLGYTNIYAPVTGIVGRKTVEVGHRIQPGQALLMIVPVDDVWVTANFKETQLRQMRPGQAATVHVDTFGRDYDGVVDELPGAAGTLFSLLPPENASGNFVKVVQRLPVRIRLAAGADAEHQLRPGMSVEANVRVTP